MFKRKTSKKIGFPTILEFDWGEVKLFINETLRTLSMAVFTLPYSNYRLAYLYESETMICVQDAHVKCIHALGFVPEVFTFDNMRTVVKIFIGNEREITDGMKSLSMHYQFKIRLCQQRKGNQKGHVEGSVEYFERWEEVFHDPVLTAVLTDRLTHRAYMIDMVGPSYRILDTKEWLEKNQV